MRKVILVVVMVLLSAQVMADMGRVSAVEVGQLLTKFIDSNS